jgi:hypothetical protein
VVAVRERRTKEDWANEIRRLVTGRYASTEKMTIVCNNFNTLVTGAFYATFPPEEARSLLDRLDFQYTPKHGSWLNIAENELSSMTRQAMHGRRFGTLASIAQQLSCWATSINEKQHGVDWQFTV